MPPTEKSSLTLLTTAVVTIAISSFVFWKWSQSKNRSVEIRELMIYPVKSCGGMKVKEAKLTARGLEGDRLCMWVDSSGAFISQRKYPKMCLIQAELLENQTILHLSAPEMEPLVINFNEAYEKSKTSDDKFSTVSVSVWKEPCEAIDIGGEMASEWIGRFLKINKSEMVYRLVRMTDDCIRLADPEYANKDAQVGFADGFPFLLASEESLHQLNSWLSSPVTIDRFRANLIVSGFEHPFEEDEWETFRVESSTNKDSNGIMLWGMKPCSRCAMPNIDQSTGVSSTDVSRVLQKYRSGKSLVFDTLNSGPQWEKSTFFGLNLDHRNISGGTVRVGDNIVLVKRRECPYGTVA